MTPKYEVIYADPPWRYDFSLTASRSIEAHYDTLGLEDIISMSPASADDSVLFLWVTAPKLDEGLVVLRAWGFTYKTCLVWDKLVIGMGHWLRGQHEILLIGTKGNFSPPPPEKRIASVLRHKRGTHSRKPPQIQKLIGEWFPDAKKLNMFSREPWPEWESQGDQKAHFQPPLFP